MSYFSEVLDEMIRQHGLHAAELCERMEISRSALSKWRSGAALPASMDTVRRLTEAMRLSMQERDKLFGSYKLARFGMSYFSISKAMERVFQLDFQCRNQNLVEVTQYARPENGTFFNHKAQVVIAIRQLLRHSGGDLQMVLLPDSNDICDVIREELHGTGRRCSWLLHLNDSCKASPENISMFFHAIPLMLDGAEVRYNYINLHSFFEYATFPFMLMTESAVLLMTRDCTAAMYFDVEEFVAFYRQEFARRYHGATVLGRCFETAEEFLAGYDAMFSVESEQRASSLYIIEKHPCVLYEGDGNLIFQHLADFPEKGLFLRRYMEFLHRFMQGVTVTHTIFSEEGMQEFFVNEQYYELSERFSQSIPVQVRRKLMRLFIGHAEKSDALQPGMLLQSILDHSCIKVVNICSDGKMIFLLEFAGELHILAVREPSIAETMISYLGFLGESGTLLPKEQTLRKLHDAWDKYGSSQS